MDNLSRSTLLDDYQRVRGQTLRLCSLLEPEDTVVQSMPDASPSKWHIAHVTWFFERMVLAVFSPGYQRYNDDFDFLFNSYYYSAGKMHLRNERGLLSRPTLKAILAYRLHVDDAVHTLLGHTNEKQVVERIVLGINHEQQHQELLLTDIKHALSCNPLKPALIHGLPCADSVAPPSYCYQEGVTGVHPVGASGAGFYFDNETPRHQALLQKHWIGKRLVTNAEYREFILDGGYDNAALWLSDGWSVINERGWSRPLYWSEDLQSEFTLGGLRGIDNHAPVTHVSYYEADAFARWAGARLPTEFEWEVSAREYPAKGNLMESGFWHPVPGKESRQFFGDAWEWTSSPYAPYPGFIPLGGSLGEYNGKFMCNQMTVRGGSCVTAADHIRPSYRSFFYPDARWQFLGIRLARDES